MVKDGIYKRIEFAIQNVLDICEEVREVKEDVRNVREEVVRVGSRLDKTNDLLEERFYRMEKEIV